MIATSYGVNSNGGGASLSILSKTNPGLSHWRCDGRVIATRRGSLRNEPARSSCRHIPWTSLSIRFNIVADQADWAFRLNGDAVVQREEVLDLIHDLGEFLVAAKTISFSWKSK